MSEIVDRMWRMPVSCRLTREHVPDPGDLFRAEVECLRCGRTYDDGVAQAHRMVRLAARNAQTRATMRGTKREGARRLSRAIVD